ncbi:ATP-binding cassette domain-containing protein [Streptomyces massasporeus]|uniref:ATP-binding cassette domain-containing protein n=1 Tax=Streptomyces massasporeus TaxID=67324 RepID=UPI003D9DEA9E
MTLVFEECRYSYRPWRRPALDGMSLVLPEGFTILLGPNGAGKSTMLKLAAAVSAPQRGTVSFRGVDSKKKEYRRLISWMPQNITPVAGLTAREYVAYVGWLKGMSKADAWDRAVRALERVELQQRMDVKTHQLSGGQMRRVGVAAALVHDAGLLLLDEPTAGMDPRQRRVFRDVVRSLSGEVQVVMSTHDIADLAEEADTVTVVNDGRILKSSSVDDFMKAASPDSAPGRIAESAYSAVLGAY